MSKTSKYVVLLHFDTLTTIRGRKVRHVTIHTTDIAREVRTRGGKRAGVHVGVAHKRHRNGQWPVRVSGRQCKVCRAQRAADKLLTVDLVKLLRASLERARQRTLFR